MSYKKEDILFYSSPHTGNTYMFVPEGNGLYTECFYDHRKNPWNVNHGIKPGDHMYRNIYNSIPYLRFMQEYYDSPVPVPEFIKEVVQKITFDILSPIQSKTVYYFTSPGGLTHTFPTKELAQAEWEKISKFNLLKELADKHGIGLYELQNLVKEYNKIQNNQ